MTSTIKVRLTNRTALITHCTDEQYAALQDFWSFAPKGLWFHPKYRPYKILKAQYHVNIKTLAKLKRLHAHKKLRIAHWERTIAEQEARLATLWDGKIQLLKHHCLPSGLFRATRKEVEEKLKVQFEVTYNRESVLISDALTTHNVSLPATYRHQAHCIQKMVDCTRKGGGIILAATGAGKTRIAAEYFKKINGQCLFVVDQIDLLYQQQTELAEWLGEEVGVVGDGTFDLRRVSVATIQTLDSNIQVAKFRRWYYEVVGVIVDELHEQMGQRNFKVLEAISPLVVFALTATLQLTQKEVRFKAYSFAGPVIFRFPLETGIRRGVLNPVKVLQLLFPYIGDPKKDVHHLEDILIQVVENEEKHSACQAIVKLLHQHGRYVVILTNRVKQLKTIAKLFPIASRRRAFGAISAEKRKFAIQAFEDGEIKLLVANKVFKKGVNIKRVDTMIDVAEMYSKNDAAQKLGRVVRLHDEKGMALYVDFGTQAGRYGKAASSRRRAWRAMNLQVKTIKVYDAEQAVSAVSKFLKREILHGPERSGELFADLD